MTVRHQHGELAERRFDPNPSIDIGWPSDLDSRRARVIGDRFAVREGKKAASEFGNLVRRYIYPVLRNGLKCRVRWRSCVPVELHIHPAGPLYDGIPPDGIIKRTDQDIR